ncbi:MAG: anti-sigma factor RsiW [Planctomycetota bacterium]|jgi:anti-sigma factor RsiW
MMQCVRAEELIPRYVDGELNDVEASPLRQHLIDCQTCRLRAQEVEALGSWFVDPTEQVGPAEAPAGFAARVAALAFAGAAQVEPLAGPRSLATAHAEEHARSRENQLQTFVLNLTGAAAILVILFAFGLQRRGMPEVGTINADATMSLFESLDDLDELNKSTLHAVSGEASTDQPQK